MTPKDFPPIDLASVTEEELTEYLTEYTEEELRWIYVLDAVNFPTTTREHMCAPDSMVGHINNEIINDNEWFFANNSFMHYESGCNGTAPDPDSPGLTPE